MSKKEEIVNNIHQDLKNRNLGILTVGGLTEIIEKHIPDLEKSYQKLPANGQVVQVIISCIDYLRDNHPYPENMKVSRKSFATARVGYEAAIFELEKFMEAMTEEIPEKARLHCPECNSTRIDSRQKLEERIDYSGTEPEVQRQSDYPPEFTCSDCGFGWNVDERPDQLCATCGKPVGEFKDEDSKKEYEISKMCQICQDFTFDKKGPMGEKLREEEAKEILNRQVAERPPHCTHCGVVVPTDEIYCKACVDSGENIPEETIPNEEK